MVFQISECGDHAIVQVLQVLGDLLLALFRGILELHAAQLVQYTAQVVLDDRPGDFVLLLCGGFNGTARSIIKANQIVQHQH